MNTADLPPTPTADEVAVLMRGQNIKLGLGAIIVIALLVVTVWFSASGRDASRDSFNATAASLANNRRSACITERRNQQADALGRISISANEAEVAGLVNDDLDEARRQLALFDRAVDDWVAATTSLSPEVLDLPTDEGGCGPPILQVSDLNANG